MASAHRKANSANSTCQISNNEAPNKETFYKESDAAHNTANMFHAAVYYDDF